MPTRSSTSKSSTSPKSSSQPAKGSAEGGEGTEPDKKAPKETLSLIDEKAPAKKRAPRAEGSVLPPLGQKKVVAKAHVPAGPAKPTVEEQ